MQHIKTFSNIKLEDIDNGNLYAVKMATEDCKNYILIDNLLLLKQVSLDGVEKFYLSEVNVKDRTAIEELGIILKASRTGLESLVKAIQSILDHKIQ